MNPLKVKVKLIVDPPLSKEDRKHLSSYVQGMKRERPGYFREPFEFQYRGSTVKVLFNKSKKSTSRKEVNAINKKIRAIFKKHRIRPGSGEEAFWNAYDDVKKKSKSDAKKLKALAKKWKKATN